MGPRPFEDEKVNACREGRFVGEAISGGIQEPTSEFWAVNEAGQLPRHDGYLLVDWKTPSPA